MKGRLLGSRRHTLPTGFTPARLCRDPPCTVEMPGPRDPPTTDADARSRARCAARAATVAAAMATDPILAADPEHDRWMDLALDGHGREDPGHGREATVATNPGHG